MPIMDLPGPKARAIIDRDRAVISPSYPRGYPFVMDHGRGVDVWDVDGNRFLDFAAGIAVVSTGHSHPQVVKGGGRHFVGTGIQIVGNPSVLYTRGEYSPR